MVWKILFLQTLDLVNVTVSKRTTATNQQMLTSKTTLLKPANKLRPFCHSLVMSWKDLWSQSLVGNLTCTIPSQQFPFFLFFFCFPFFFLLFFLSYYIFIWLKLCHSPNFDVYSYRFIWYNFETGFCSVDPGMFNSTFQARDFLRIIFFLLAIF